MRTRDMLLFGCREVNYLGIRLAIEQELDQKFPGPKWTIHTTWVAGINEAIDALRPHRAMDVVYFKNEIERSTDQIVADAKRLAITIGIRTKPTYVALAPEVHTLEQIFNERDIITVTDSPVIALMAAIGHQSL